MKINCIACKSDNITKLLKIDAQPISNRFLLSPSKEEYTHPITMVQCNFCGLIQLTDSIPWTQLTPKYSWISYNEPEKHLDYLTERITNLPKISQESKILGISYKEDSILARLSKKGFNNIYRLTAQDLGITNSNAGIETIQANLTLAKAEEIASKNGKYDLIIARHILEHCHNSQEFIEALKALVTPNGYIIFEIPDTSYCLENNIYTTIWEEHTLYFTPFTFKAFFPFFGLQVQDFYSYEYPNENSLVAITSPGPSSKNHIDKNELEKEKLRAHSFASNFQDYKSNLLSFFSNYPGKTAFLGAGHHACAFINYFNLSKYIDFIADDNPNKQGLYMPGSKVSIHGSDMLLKKNIKICLIALSPESEEKVLQKNTEFLNSGGEFISIFSGSIYAIDKFIRESTSFKMKKTGEGIFYLDGNPTIKKSDLDFLKSEAKNSKTKRARFCTHHDASDKMHDMLIVLSKETYIRPHKHFKPESGHVIEGTADLIFFDDSGSITNVIQLDSSSSNKDFYYRINYPVYHAQIVNSENFVFHENTTGPFIKEETIYASWAPEEADIITKERYITSLREQVKEFLAKKQK